MIDVPQLLGRLGSPEALAAAVLAALDGNPADGLSMPQNDERLGPPLLAWADPTGWLARNRAAGLVRWWNDEVNSYPRWRLACV